MRLTRRQFSKLSALSLGAAHVPRAIGGQEPPRIGYCVIGLGRIATHFLEGVRNSQHSKITALVSGHRDKAERIAAQYGVPRESIYSYEEFDRIGQNKAIDAVYVALPNSMHAEYTIRAAKAGKHVLCEKPMAISSAECHLMIDACKAAKVKLMIAYRLHYEPITLKTLEIVRSGRIGPLQAMEAANGFNIKFGEWRYTKALGGGGSLFDVGIYCLNAFRMFAGQEPIGFQGEVATIDRDERFKEVEENVSWLMRFPSGALATGASTYGADMAGFYRLHGAYGWLQVGTYTYQGQHLQGRYAEEPHRDAKRIDIDETNQEKDPMHFVREADHFSQCILQNTEPKTPGEEGLADLRCIEAIYKAAGAPLHA
ncbi:Gfo/Idh/MocA family protein [Terriglobus albidus]|uniref:Gfo/Idh/MocA family protein n=1 Tax=Terriglobus albidus TaxID=1592106 RepID=UPI0021E0B3E7|nr:Gfo/Idh/MocA family oxidoreductase [Terriglobus albidus]